MTPKNAAAVALGRKGGTARAKKLSAEERSDSARKASEARWAKTKAALIALEKTAEERVRHTKKKAAK